MTEHLDGYDDDERALFAALPRETPLNPAREEALVASLREAGYFDRGSQRLRIWVGLAIAAGLVVTAWIGGVRYGSSEARASSIEGMLTRKSLSRDERVLLMQRAGSAYVEAAHAYAANVAVTDSTAIEVSSQVLLGAAQAVARTNLDGGMGPRLSALIRDARLTGRATKPSIIWY